MPTQIEIARQWVAKASNDLLNADNNLAAKETPHDTVCFHCQQAAEKLLKAFLIANAQPAARTHDLLLLLEAILPTMPGAESLRESLIVLAPYAVESRYPDDDGFLPDLEAAKEARAAAGEVLSWLQQSLPQAFGDSTKSATTSN